jgi:hypothetical protein
MKVTVAGVPGVEPARGRMVRARIVAAGEVCRGEFISFV